MQTLIYDQGKSHLPTVVCNLQTTQENLRISKEFKQFIQELKLISQITFYSIRFWKRRKNIL